MPRRVVAGRPLRVVALGASNLTRALPTLVGLARTRWGRDTEVIAALGLGRSYGATSRVLVRTLPGLLQCGLWGDLERRPQWPTRALITDVGNDILYGSPPAEILTWVEACVERLQATTADIVVTDLPVQSLRRISPLEYLIFRTVLFPPCRLSLAEVLDSALRVSEGLVDLAGRRRLRFVHLEREWYGFDPIHIRPSRWGTAWGEILGPSDERAGNARMSLVEGEPRTSLGEGDAGTSLGEGEPRTSLGEALRLHAMRPEQEGLLGFDRITPQRGRPLSGGGRVWLY